MCGRTICMLCPDDIRKACSYKTNKGGGGGKNSTWRQPVWRTSNDNGGKQRYVPSYNIAPTSYTPIMVSGKHFAGEEEFAEEDRVIQPMMWGLVPSWHKGKASEFSFKTNNCRSESFLSKPMFKNPVDKGRRCVVVCEGYYEWKTEKDKKQPYLIHSLQPENVTIYDEKWHSDISHADWNETDGWNGPRLLFLAGIFDIWTPESDPIYSYSVLTMESSESLSWLHHRMPVILETEQAVSDWLNYESLPIKKVQHLVKQVPQRVTWYAVSDTVNNSRNNSSDCILPAHLKKPKISAESKMMMSWLKKKSDEPNSGKRKCEVEEDGCEKKVKKDSP